jgi:hypothetical protein
MAQIQPVTTYEYLLYTTVRLEITIPGDTSIGTGFLYDHYTAGGEKIPLLITNRHAPIPTQSMFPMNLGYAIKAGEVVTLARHLEATSTP